MIFYFERLRRRRGYYFVFDCLRVYKNIVNFIFGKNFELVIRNLSLYFVLSFSCGIVSKCFKFFEFWFFLYVK